MTLYDRSIDEHMKFLMGNCWENIRTCNWKNMPFWKNSYTVDDLSSVEYIRDKVIVEDFINCEKLNNNGNYDRLRNLNMYFRFNDKCGVTDKVVVSHSRLIHKENYVMLYPRVNRLQNFYYKNCLKHDKSFDKKKSGILWRGSDSTDSCEIDIFGRTTRLEICRKYKDHKLFDFGLTVPKQIKDGEILEKDKDLFKGKVKVYELVDHKYNVFLEGNDCSSGLLWGLAGNTVPIVPYPMTFETDWMDGYYVDGVKIELTPYQHFIPIKQDTSDLEEKYNWCLSHEKQCLEIIEGGKKFARDFLRDDFFLETRKKFVSLYNIPRKTNPHS